VGGTLFCSKVHQDRLATSAVAGLHVVEDVSDHPGAGEVDISSGSDLQQHPWLRFAAGAGDGQVRYGAVDMVRAVGDRAQLDAPDA